MRDEPLHWTVRPGSRDDIEVIALHGPLTLANIFDLQKMLSETKPAAAIVDMAGVPYMDSAGLGVLMNFYVAAEKNGRRVAVVGPNQRVDAILGTTRVRDLLRTSVSVDEAESKLALA